MGGGGGAVSQLSLPTSEYLSPGKRTRGTSWEGVGEWWGWVEGRGLPVNDTEKQTGCSTVSSYLLGHSGHSGPTLLG